MTTIDVGQIRFKKCAVCQEPSTNLIVKGVAIAGTRGSSLRLEVDGDYPAERIEFRCDKHFGFSSEQENEKMFKQLQEMGNNTKLYALGDENHEGLDGLHGMFSTLAEAEAYQFDNNLGRTMTDLKVLRLDDPSYQDQVIQLIRLNEEMEAAIMAKDPNYKAEKLANCTRFCDDCNKQLTACWGCGFYHCKCK